MHIVIVYGHLQHLEVDLPECVFEVKEKSQLLGHPVCKQILSFNGEELTDWIGLNLLDVTENARLNLTINSTQKPFKMKVKILGGEIFLEVEEMDTVVSLKDLKDKILDKIGDPHEEQLAPLYRGNEMRNDQHLCEYRVGMNSEIIATCGENWPFIEFDEFDIRDGPRSHCRRSEGTPGGQELPPTR